MRTKEEIALRLFSKAYQDNDTEYALGYREAIQWILSDDKADDAYALLADVRALEQKIEMYKECFERYIPDNVKDEATEFLSTYGSALAKDMKRRES